MKTGRAATGAPKPDVRAATTARNPKRATTSAATAVDRLGLRPLYRVHPGVRMLLRWESELEAKTGRTIDGWCALLARECRDQERAARVAFLKREHSIGTNAASWIAERSLGLHHPWDASEDGYLAHCPAVVDAQFAGGKEHLRGIADALLDLCRACGDDVGISPCETIIPAYRNHVFAQVSVPNRSVVRLGLSLRGEPFTARLVDTGGTRRKDRITHRIDVATLGAVDAELRRALRRAYEADA